MEHWRVAHPFICRESKRMDWDSVLQPSQSAWRTLGFVFWVGSLAALSWKFGFVIPYTYTMFNYLKDGPPGKAVVPPVDIHLLAIGYFLVITGISYVLYVTKKEKG